MLIIFLIYNVYGYTGQLMMINAKYNPYINNSDNENIRPTDEENEGLLYGLAIAVIPNASNNVYGDYKGLLNTSNSFQKPADFSISESILNTKLPGEITKQDIQLMNDVFFKNNDSKPFIISDINDESGTFKITANLYKIPWFATSLPNDSTLKVVSYTFDGKGSNKKAQQIKNKVSWKVLNSSTDYDFMNTLPSKISVNDIQVFDPFQASFQSQTIVSSEGKQLYPKSTYEIESTNDESEEIKIKVTYKYVIMSATYTNGSNNIAYKFGSKSIIEQQVLTYVSKQTYIIFKKYETSAFRFTGTDSKSTDNNEISIDTSKVPELRYLLSANTLPSSFTNLNNSSDSSNSNFLPFINTSSSKGYPISKMKFNVTADDKEGTLDISATIPTSYSPDNKEHTFKVKYTGLNKTTEYKFNFKDKVSSVFQIDIKNVLPSSIDKGDVFRDFITYSGFNSNDLTVSLFPNDITGTITVQVNLNRNYASIIGNSGHGFTNYIASKTYTGFMNTSEYNTRFSVDFVSDSDSKLFNLKSRQAQEIITAFGNNGTGGSNSLIVDNVKYTNLKEFVEKLLVQSKGTSIPSNWNDNSNIKVDVYVDNSLGLASFYVMIPKTEMLGATSDLNLVVTYSGFAKGNVVTTSDNFSFVSNVMLKNHLIANKSLIEEQWNNFTTSTFASWINENVDKIISYKTGEYITKLSSNQYNVTTVTNELQGTVTVTINFGNMKNSSYLSEYSIQNTL